MQENDKRGLNDLIEAHRLAEERFIASVVLMEQKLSDSQVALDEAEDTMRDE